MPTLSLNHDIAITDSEQAVKFIEALEKAEAMNKMERLTFEGNFCDIAKCEDTPGGSFCEYGCCDQRRVWERLKAYEDIGTVEEFAAYKQAKSKGRLVVLPCKAGDTIYQLRNKKHAKGKGISPRIVACVTVFGSKMYRVEHQGATPCEAHELGKTWFLTREEASAALAAKEGERE